MPQGRVSLASLHTISDGEYFGKWPRVNMSIDSDQKLGDLRKMVVHLWSERNRYLPWMPRYPDGIDEIVVCNPNWMWEASKLNVVYDEDTEEMEALEEMGHDTFESLCKKRLELSEILHDICVIVHHCPTLRISYMYCHSEETDDLYDKDPIRSLDVDINAGIVHIKVVGGPLAEHKGLEFIEDDAEEEFDWSHYLCVHCQKVKNK
jgi:hypothetical protein